MNNDILFLICKMFNPESEFEERCRRGDKSVSLQCTPENWNYYKRKAEFSQRQQAIEARMHRYQQALDEAQDQYRRYILSVRYLDTYNDIPIAGEKQRRLAQITKLENELKTLKADLEKSDRDLLEQQRGTYYDLLNQVDPETAKQIRALHDELDTLG